MYRQPHNIYFCKEKITRIVSFQSDDDVSVSWNCYCVFLWRVFQIQSGNISKVPILISPGSAIATLSAAFNVSVSI